MPDLRGRYTAAAGGQTGNGAAMIQVTRNISIDDDELEFSFVRASGPGGQNVNKVATAVQLRFDAAGSLSLPDPLRQRLLKLAGTRATADGVVIIEARRYRSQQRNRQDAEERLVALIRRAARPPKVRKETGPTAGSRERRLDSKRRRSAAKRLRRPPEPED
jgi:ribosome-associated protein